MPFASALSEHPIPSVATGEVLGVILETLGGHPDIAVVSVTRPHAGALGDIASTLASVLHPLAAIGCAAASVVGTGREIEEVPAISLWAARIGPVLALTLHATRLPGDVWHFAGWPDASTFEPTALILIADPFTFPVARFLDWMDDVHPRLPVIGGNASGALGPGANRLVVGGRTTNDGAVGVLIGSGVDVVPVVSQGGRPYGRTLTVTRSDRNVLYEVAGIGAIACMVEQMKASLTSADAAAVETHGLHIGRLIDERLDQPRPGDYLVRSVVGMDRSSGAMAVDDHLPLGTTIRFHLRDAASSDRDLHALLRGTRADGALLFTGIERGWRLFDEPHHDASVVADEVGGVPVGGFAAAGEFGPVGGQNFVHRATASMALFRDR